MEGDSEFHTLPDHLMMVDGLKPRLLFGGYCMIILPDHLMMVDGLKPINPKAAQYRLHWASRPSDDGRWIETRFRLFIRPIGALLPDHLMMVDGLKLKIVLLLKTEQPLFFQTI